MHTRYFPLQLLDTKFHEQDFFMLTLQLIWDLCVSKGLKLRLWKD